MADLDRCKVCASIRLVRRLGEVECRECGNVGEPAVVTSSARSAVDIASGAADGLTAPGLAEEVEQALARVLRRSAMRRADQLR